MFVSWCFDQAGAANLAAASSAKGFAYCPSGAGWYQKRGAWGTSPRVGAVVFFRFPGGPARIHHVGIVTGINPDGSIETLEGNTSRGSAGFQRDGGGVWRRRRKAGVVGYGSPQYAGGGQPVPQTRQVPSGDGAERVRQFQCLLGTPDDGDFGAKTTAACNGHFVGVAAEVNRRNPSKPKMENRRDIVECLQHQANRRGSPLAVDGETGPATNHWIVVGLGQSDAICGANGFREACR